MRQLLAIQLFKMVDNKEQITGLQIHISSLTQQDIPLLEPILRQRVRDSETGVVIEEEVQSIINYMRGVPEESRMGNVRRYLVAKDRLGRVLGCVAYCEPEPDMLHHFGVGIEEAVEGLNLFVDETFGEHGVGTKPVSGMFQAAKAEGKKYVIANSGPRYKRAWTFHDKCFDERRGFLLGKFGPGADAMTWIKNL